MTTRENDITESFTGDRMSILNEIAARTKERIAEEKFKFPLRELISQQNSDPVSYTHLDVYKRQVM